MNLEEKIELFFFDPRKSREEYIEYYKQINPQRYIDEGERYRYSPLFLLLKDIRYCFGLGAEFNPIRSNLATAEFAAVVLLRICFTNTVKRIYFGDLDKFAEEYMGITGEENLEGLGLLRNALEHSYYSLYTYKEKNGIKTKFYFSLGSFDFVIKKNENWQRPYPSEMFFVNPKKLYSAFENGTRLLKAHLQDPVNTRHRENFEQNLSLDEWILTGNN